MADDGSIEPRGGPAVGEAARTSPMNAGLEVEVPADGPSLDADAARVLLRLLRGIGRAAPLRS